MSQTVMRSQSKTSFYQKYKKLLFACVILSVFGIAAIFGISAFVTHIGKQYFISETEAPQVDAILVLGARVYTNGTPSPLLQDRLDYGYRLYQQGKAERIIVSGDHGQKEYNEVQAMKAYLLAKGVPEEHIFMDHAGFNTYDSLCRTKEVFQVKSLIICTQEFHMPRAVYIGRRLGIETYGYPAPDKEIYHMANE